jgi:hypothetical protein
MVVWLVLVGLTVLLETTNLNSLRLHLVQLSEAELKWFNFSAAVLKKLLFCS